MRLPVLLGFVILAFCCSCGPGTPQKTIKAGSLELSAVDSLYHEWKLGNLSVKGWGVRVLVTNPSDKPASQSVAPSGLQMVTADGEAHGLDPTYLSQFFLANLENNPGVAQLQMDGDEFSVQYWENKELKGEFKRAFAGDAPFRFMLDPKKSISVLFIFKGPEGSKPVSLRWPGSKPLALQQAASK